MVLIIGGAYQGKLVYAVGRFPGKGVYRCEDGMTELDFASGAGIIYGLHKLILGQVRAGGDPLGYAAENIGALSGKVIICDDVSCGVVPIDPVERRYRECTGRVLGLLSGRADEVIRVFCGIGTRIK